MRHGIANSPFGPLRLAESDAGLCWLSVVTPAHEDLIQLQKAYPTARETQDESWPQSIVNQWIDDLPTPRLAPHGTPFQLIVWNELLNTTVGSSYSYSELAARIGRPTAVRAVASAVARNPIALFIPCHRVLPKSGGIGNYRWGADRKRAILEWERQGQSTERGR